MESPILDDPDGSTPWDSVPLSLLATGPLLVMAVVAVGLYVLWPFGDIEAIAAGTTLEIVGFLAIVGAIAGIVPVAIGMLWFPFIRSVEPRVIHAFLALATGVLAFIAVEMTGGMVGAGADADYLVAGSVAVLGIAGTFAVMYWVSSWSGRVADSGHKTGLQIAYLVAFALGLHSIGEGLAIGVSLTQGEAALVLLLVVGFVVHNILEGLTCVAAMARDHRTPRLWHFAAIGLIAGGPVILGGWIGSLGDEPLLAVIFYAVAIGAIVQAIVEMVDLVRLDAGGLLTRVNAAALVAGFLLMFVLEEIIVDMYIVG